MKVVHVIDSGGLYGAEIMLLSLLEEQKKLAIEPEVISIGLLGQSEKALEKELALRNITVHKVRMSPLPKISQSLKILNICKSSNASIIHSHGYKGNVLLGILPRWIRRIPVVTTLHGYTKHRFFSKMTIYQFVDKCMVRFLDAIILVSPTLKAQINLFGVNKKVHVIPNGIPMLDAANDVKKKDSTEFIIGSIGRLCKEKNFVFLINMMPKVLELIPNAKLIIHGEGEQRTLLLDEIKRLNLEQYIYLPGYVHKPHDFLKDIDLYINCSLTEGMPITLLEAMRAKCLVLASNIAANNQLLHGDYKINMLFELNGESFINAICKYHEASLHKKEAQAEMLYKMYIDSYTSVAMAKKYKTLYETLL
jgi:glycosyltransferase involved in cell wall biosynthesis